MKYRVMDNRMKGGRLRILGLLVPVALAALVGWVLVLAPGAASAQEEDGRISFDRDLVIQKGEIVEGDVSVTNGDLKVLGEVRGDVVVFGGDAEIAGRVSGDVSALGGQVRVEPGAYVAGNIVAQEIHAAEEATVLGRRSEMHLPRFGWGNFAAGPEAPAAPGRPSGPRSVFTTLWLVFVAGVAGFLLLLIAGGVAVLASRRVEIARATMEAAPGPSLVVGLVAAFLLVPLFGVVAVVLMVSVIGIILLPVLVLGFGLALVFGLVVVSQWLGKRLYETPHSALSKRVPLPVGQALVGQAVIMASTVIPMPFLPSWASGTLLGLLYFTACAGLGAAVLSRFGTLLPPRYARGVSVPAMPSQPAPTTPLGPPPVFPQETPPSQPWVSYTNSH